MVLLVSASRWWSVLQHNLAGMPTLTLHERTVAYDEAGGGAAPPLLLVHGFTGGRDDFADVVEPLAADRRVVAVDLPGHGGSAGADDPDAYGLQTLAGWVLDVAEALDLGEHHLLGHSMGGLVAQRAAATASQRLRSLLLMDTGVGALREELGERVVQIAVAARDEGPDAALAVSLDGAELPPAELAAARERFHRLNPAAVVGAARGLVTAAPLGAFLRGIDMPVLVIHGEHDEAWLPSEQRLLAGTVAGAVHVIVPDAAHSPQRENLDFWVAVVRRFLLRADAGD
jgi:pimeloyl-ACP methyl ester carboxylesterase